MELPDASVGRSTLNGAVQVPSGFSTSVPNAGLNVELPPTENVTENVFWIFPVAATTSPRVPLENPPGTNSGTPAGTDFATLLPLAHAKNEILGELGSALASPVVSAAIASTAIPAADTRSDVLMPTPSPRPDGAPLPAAH